MGWIVVEDRLPRPQERVLIAYTDHRKRLTRTIGWYSPSKTVESSDFEGEVDDEYDEASDTYYMKEGWVDESQESEYHYRISSVTHWMPIPPHPLFACGDQALENNNGNSN